MTDERKYAPLFVIEATGKWLCPKTLRFKRVTITRHLVRDGSFSTALL
jgi:hypothetical protein